MHIFLDKETDLAIRTAAFNYVMLVITFPGLLDSLLAASKILVFVDGIGLLLPDNKSQLPLVGFMHEIKNDEIPAVEQQFRSEIMRTMPYVKTIISGVVLNDEKIGMEQLKEARSILAEAFSDTPQWVTASSTVMVLDFLLDSSTRAN